jgi:hypothetical protein
MPIRTVTVGFGTVSNATHCLPLAANGREKRATKYTGYLPRVHPETSSGAVTTSSPVRCPPPMPCLTATKTLPRGPGGNV